MRLLARLTLVLAAAAWLPSARAATLDAPAAAADGFVPRLVVKFAATGDGGEVAPVLFEALERAFRLL